MGVATGPRWSPTFKPYVWGASPLAVRPLPPPPPPPPPPPKPRPKRKRKPKPRPKPKPAPVVKPPGYVNGDEGRAAIARRRTERLVFAVKPAPGWTPMTGADLIDLLNGDSE